MTAKSSRLNLTQRVEMAEMTVADLRQLLAATMEAKKATAEAGQANALRITEINSALDKLALTQEDLVRSAAKVESTIDRVIQANTGLDRSVEELKQSMEWVATRLTSMETTAPKLSTPESVDRDPGLFRPEGHRPQQRFQGTGLGEYLTSSRALVRGERSVTDTRTARVR